MNPIRVCFLIANLDDGGAQRQSLLLLQELTARPEVEAQLFSLHSGINEALLSELGHLRWTNMNVRSNYSPRNIWRLWRALRRERPCIIVSWLLAPDIYSFFLRLALPRILWVLMERNSDYPVEPKFVIRRFLGRYADAIVANSSEGAAYWQRAGARGPWFVLPNIVAIDRPRTMAPNRSMIVYVGRMEAQKNVEVVVRAFCLLAMRRPEADFSRYRTGLGAAPTDFPCCGIRLAGPRVLSRIST